MKSRSMITIIAGENCRLQLGDNTHLTTHHILDQPFWSSHIQRQCRHRHHMCDHGGHNDTFPKDVLQKR